jgi:gamma-glutamyltranspeptidase/glutathione hydrolase
MSVTLKIERRLGAAIVAALQDAGHDVELVDPWSDLVGHAGAIVRHPGGTMAGASDPRSDGAVAAL